MTATFTFEGQYYDGRHPVPSPASLSIAGDGATLSAAEFSERYDVRLLKVSPRIAGSDRFIVLPTGAQLQCRDVPLLDVLPQESPTEGLVAWLESRWKIALAGVVIVVSLLAIGYLYGLPAAAELVVARIPVESEQAMGRQALSWLDQNGWFKPTGLVQEERRAIREGFDRLCDGLPLNRHYHLEFRHSSFLGANAIALPGGTIVITDEMVRAARTPEEVLAVLAHEVGHVELRHALRQLLQGSAVSVAVAAVTADAASLGMAVAGLPTLLAHTRYSREFEAEADDFAFDLLKRRGHSPAAFGDLMERIAKAEDRKESRYDFLSTHPFTAERVTRARAAAAH